MIPWLLTVGVVVAVVFLIANLLGDAALFFYNADEAVERRVELGDDRFRVQGTPLEDTIIEGFRGDQPVVVFSLVYEVSASAEASALREGIIVKILFAAGLLYP